MIRGRLQFPMRRTFCRPLLFTAARWNSTTTTANDAAPEGDASKHYDPWAVMGVKQGASPHDIRVRYHELLRQYHPDYVPKGEVANVEMLQKVEQAYQLITKSPTLDKRYRNLMTDSQHYYYRLLPQWIAKNIDEMPRYWSWMRWKLSGAWFWVFFGIFMYVYGKMAARYPIWAACVGLSFVVDVMCHTMLTPPVLTILFLKSIFGGDTYSLSWLQSPKHFLTRGLTY